MVRKILTSHLGQNILLTLIAAVYYIPFLNKGLIFYDEGYMVHFAQRIVMGQVPYYDFFIQYTPGFFYLLALFFKLFGTQIIVGRIVTMVIALLILFATLFLLDVLRINSLGLKLAATVILVAFGFPLFNIPIDVWPCILLTVGMMISFVMWYQNTQKAWVYALMLGIVLALMLFVKQNLGLGFLGLQHVLFLFSSQKSLREKIQSMIVMDGTFFLLSAPWIYFFFLHNTYLSSFMAFNKHFFATYPLSYPSPLMIITPLGLFKLLPYYLPIVFFFVLIYAFFFTKGERLYLFCASIPLLGFGMTVIPASDLLHVYPYLGLTLVMFLVFLSQVKIRLRFVYQLFIALTVLSGFYLTFFKGQYRYGLPYQLDTTTVSVPAARGLVVDPATAKYVTVLNDFISTHTQKNDFIFVYPFSPMLYVLLDRQNPTRFANTLPGYLTQSEEKQTIHALQDKHVAYVIAAGNYKNKTLLSLWMQQHTVPILETSGTTILKVKKESK